MASHACVWNTAYKDSLVHVLATEYAADIDMSWCVLYYHHKLKLDGRCDFVVLSPEVVVYL